MTPDFDAEAWAKLRDLFAKGVFYGDMAKAIEKAAHGLRDHEFWRLFKTWEDLERDASNDGWTLSETREGMGDEENWSSDDKDYIEEMERDLSKLQEKENAALEELKALIMKKARTTTMRAGRVAQALVGDVGAYTSPHLTVPISRTSEGASRKVLGERPPKSTTGPERRLSEVLDRLHAVAGVDAGSLLPLEQASALLSGGEKGSVGGLVSAMEAEGFTLQDRDPSEDGHQVLFKFDPVVHVTLDDRAPDVVFFHWLEVPEAERLKGRGRSLVVALFRAWKKAGFRVAKFRTYAGGFWEKMLGRPVAEKEVVSWPLKKPLPVLKQVGGSVVDAAGLVFGADRNQGLVVSIPVPANYAMLWPDPEVHNHGHEPHVTVLYVKSGDVSAGEASTVMEVVRRVCRRFPPFRLRLDVGAGLQDFGDGANGEKALWLPVLGEPRGELERLHRFLKRSLEDEGLEMEGHAEFRPHCAWTYVANTVSEADRGRIDRTCGDRLRRGVAWDVNSVTVSVPSGDKLVMLNPLILKVAAEQHPSHGWKSTLSAGPSRRGV